MSMLGALVAMAVVGLAPTQEISKNRLDVLVEHAIERNPAMVAAQQRILAAKAQVDPAGLRPDPMLSFAIRNYSAIEAGFGEPMAVKSIGISQQLPYPGKLSLARQAARSEVVAARATLSAVRLELERKVRQAYFDLVFVDRSLEVVARHAGVLDALVSTAEVQYAVGRAGSQDVLQAQVETAALADEASRLTERRHGVVAAINSLLSRPPLTAIQADVIPERLVLAASQSQELLSFASLDPGARVSNSPLRTLEDLLAAVLVANPTIQVRKARIRAQGYRIELAQKAALPDLDVALTYGQRSGRGDLVSLSVAFPLPLHRRMRQGALVDETQAEFAALEASLRGHADGLLAQVTQLHAALERDRSSLALLTGAIIPQRSAALQATMAGFGVAATDFQSVLTIQTALFQHEIRFHQLITDFAKTLAELEQLVAQEVLR